MQFDTPERGFSFLQDAPLDMRFGPHISRTAADLVNEYSERELADLIYQYGEERFSRPIARELKRAQPQTTSEAVEAVKRAVPRKAWSKIHVATRTFQALRIAVNGELEALDQALAALPAALRPGGVAAIISFHSLEDRRVKHAFRDLAAAKAFAILTKKPIEASPEETRANPRARSAKLRALEKRS